MRVNDQLDGIPPHGREVFGVVVLTTGGNHGLFLGHGITCRWFWAAHYDRKDPHYWYYKNIEDPNERGYDALRRLFLRSMAETLPGLLN